MAVATAVAVASGLGGRATVGLASLAPTHPLAGGAGTDNKVAIWSDRYRAQPLVIYAERRDKGGAA